MMLQRTLITITIVSLCLLLLLLTTTTPATAGPFGLLAIFLSAYLTFLGTISFFLYGGMRALTFFLSGFAVRKPLRSLSLRKAYYYATVLATAPVMLIGLQSVGAIGIYEVLLVAIFIGIGCVYVSKRTT
jgi:hypothetical protein